MTEQVRGQGAAAQAYFVYTKPSQRRHSCLLRLFWRVFSCVNRPNVAVFVHVNRRRVLRKLDLDAVFRCRAAERLGHGVGLKCDRCAHVDLHDEVHVRDAYRSDIHRELAALDIGQCAAHQLAVQAAADAIPVKTDERTLRQRGCKLFGKRRNGVLPSSGVLAWDALPLAVMHFSRPSISSLASQ